MVNYFALSKTHRNTLKNTYINVPIRHLLRPRLLNFYLKFRHNFAIINLLNNPVLLLLLVVAVVV